MGSRLDRVTNWEKIAGEVSYNSRNLAEACDVSIRTLERHFHRHFNTSPEKWLHTLRLTVAEKLIVQTNLQVKEIACALGFAQASQFSKEFKRHSGLSPTVFAQKQANSNAHAS